MPYHFPIDSFKRVILYSPHCDDVAYSLGGMLLEYATKWSVHIVNVFSISAYTKDLIDVSRAQEITKWRKTEELRVVDVLKCSLEFWDYPEILVRNKTTDLDAPFSMTNQVDKDSIYEDIEHRIFQQVKHTRNSIFFFPLSIGDHIDHRIMFEIGARLVIQGFYNIIFYEDLPYRCLDFPDTKISLIEKRGLVKMVPFLFKMNNIQQKLLLINIYSSQLNARDWTLLRTYHDYVRHETIWGIQTKHLNYNSKS